MSFGGSQHQRYAIFLYKEIMSKIQLSEETNDTRVSMHASRKEILAILQPRDIKITLFTY